MMDPKTALLGSYSLGTMHQCPFLCFILFCPFVRFNSFSQLGGGDFCVMVCGNASTSHCPVCVALPGGSLGER
jgi:hypothetical protein